MRDVTPKTLSRRVTLRLLVTLASTVLAVMLSANRVIEAQEDLSAEEFQPTKQEPGFQIPQNEEVLTAITDFQRYVSRQDWNRAFQVLQDLPIEKRVGMSRTDEGYFIPARERIWRAVTSLPAEGREAFRLFYNAKAEQLFQRGRVLLETDPDAGATLLQEVYQDYFLTSSGDDAASLLGDIAMEQGDFLLAESYWNAIVSKHPEAGANEGRLLVKRATALKLAGRPLAANRVRQQLIRRFGMESMQLGGKTTTVQEFLDDLFADSTDGVELSGTPIVRREIDVATFPESTAEPVWQSRYVSGYTRSLIQKSVVENSWRESGLATYVPNYVTDEERLYCNWFGVTFALDLKSGKLLWRSDKFDKLHDKFPNIQQGNVSLERFHLLLVDGKLFSVAAVVDNLDSWQVPMHLISLDPASGDVRWSTKSIKSLESESFLGRPLWHDGTLYALSHPADSQQLTLRAMNPETGTEHWNATLGTLSKLSTSNGNERDPLPVLAADAGKLLVLTNNGALIQFDLGRHEIESVFRFESPKTADADGNGNVYGQGSSDATIKLHTSASLWQREGNVYCKEAGGRVLFALDPANRQILWQRPMDRAAMIVGMDDTTLYTMSSELMAIDRETRALRWSIALPIESGGLTLLSTGKNLLVNTRRGLYELSRETGDVQQIFRGPNIDDAGGSLCRAGNLLLCISGHAITAYEQSTSPANEPATP